MIDGKTKIKLWTGEGIEADKEYEIGLETIYRKFRESKSYWKFKFADDDRKSSYISYFIFSDEGLNSIMGEADSDANKRKYNLIEEYVLMREGGVE